MGNEDDFDEDDAPEDEEPSRFSAFGELLIDRISALGIGEDGEIVARVTEENDAEFVELYQITVKPEARGRGIGGRMLDALVSLADEMDAEVVLEPAPNMDFENGGLDADRLRAWYASRGFVDDGGGSMWRRPNPAPTASP